MKFILSCFGLRSKLLKISNDDNKFNLFTVNFVFFTIISFFFPLLSFLLCQGCPVQQCWSWAAMGHANEATCCHNRIRDRYNVHVRF